MIFQTVVGVLLVIQTSWEHTLSSRKLKSERAPTNNVLNDSEDFESLCNEQPRGQTSGHQPSDNSDHIQKGNSEKVNKVLKRKLKNRIYRINTCITILIFLVMVVNITVSGLRQSFMFSDNTSPASDQSKNYTSA